METVILTDGYNQTTGTTGMTGRDRYRYMGWALRRPSYLTWHVPKFRMGMMMRLVRSFAFAGSASQRSSSHGQGPTVFSLKVAGFQDLDSLHSQTSSTPWLPPPLLFPLLPPLPPLPLQLLPHPLPPTVHRPQ